MERSSDKRIFKLLNLDDLGKSKEIGPRVQKHTKNKRPFYYMRGKIYGRNSPTR